MPYELRRHGNQWCVHKQDTGEKVLGGCHGSRAEAVDHMRALYANVPDAEKKSMDETEVLITFGGAVKSLGEGRIGGYLISYSNANAPDLQGEFFTKATDFGDPRPETSTVYYHHGMDASLGKMRLGTATLKYDEDGVYAEVDLWADAQKAKREEYGRRVPAEYRKAILGLAQKGLLNWSSGTASHLVERESVRNAFALKSWPLGIDASLTPIPAQPHGTAALPLKSWVAPSLEEMLSEEQAEPDAVKSTYDTAASGRTSYDRVSGAASRHMSAHHAVVLAAGSGSLKADEAVAGLNRSSTLLEGLCSKKSAPEAQEFSVKSILAPGMDTEEKAERVVAIITGFAQLMDEKHAARVKSGRRLSKATCDSIASVMESLKQLLGNEDEVLPDEPAGPASEQKSEEAASAPEAHSALVAQYLRFQTERGREILGHVSGA